MHFLGFNRWAFCLVGKKLNVTQVRPFPDGLCFVCVLRACLYQVHLGCCLCQPTASSFLWVPFTSWFWTEIQQMSCTEWSFLLGISTYVASLCGSYCYQDPDLRQQFSAPCFFLQLALSPYPGNGFAIPMTQVLSW